MKSILLLIFGLSVFTIYSQSKIQVKNVQAIPLGVYYVEKGGNNYTTGGLNFGLDIGLCIYNQNVRLQSNAGTEISILGSDTNFYYSINALYEKDLTTFKWLDFNPYVGLGLQYQSISEFSLPVKSTHFNFPVGFRLVLSPQTKLSLGLQFQGEFNSEFNTYSGSLFLRFNFKNK